MRAPKSRWSWLWATAMVLGVCAAGACGDDAPKDEPGASKGGAKGGEKGGEKGAAGGEKGAPSGGAPAAAAGAPKAGAPAAAPVAAKPAAPAPEMTKEQLLAEARKRQLTNEDFVESDSNRDPFHSFLSTFAVQVVVNKQHRIILEKFSLDELKLIAIVGGEGVPARAMFLDPGGLGVPVSRGDHVSKSDATVTRIAPDRVFFQVEEDTGSGKPRQSERVIELHQGESLSR